MKLSKKAISKISNRESILNLALALGFTEIWINKLIEANKDNGPLTTIKAINTIQEDTGLTQEEILVAEKTAA